MTPIDNYEYSAERLRTTHEAFTRRQVELECARAYGSADQIAIARATLRDTAKIYASRLMEHSKYVMDYSAYVTYSASNDK